MSETPTAPECIVLGCTRLSALTDETRGAIHTFRANYCSDCYTSLLAGADLQIDKTRLIVVPREVALRSA